MVSGRQKTMSNPHSDIISNLPCNIKNNILKSMPLRDAVRTSILSRKWRYNWTKIPELVFDDSICGRSAEYHFSRNKLMTIINQVLLLHDGPLWKIVLTASVLESCCEIDQLILYLSKTDIQIFTLQIAKGERYKLPSSLFSFRKLEKLDLYGCVVIPPLDFDGFSELRCLHLFEVDIDSDTLGKLVSNCPLLNCIQVGSSTSFGYLEIDAPMLKTLFIEGNFNYICLKNTPLLDFVSISAKHSKHLEHVKVGETSNMVEVLGHLPVVTYLFVGHSFMKFLILGGVPEKLPYSLNCLKTLELDPICFQNIEDLSFVLCMIKSSPNLEKVTLEAFPFGEVVEPVLELLQVQHHSDVSFYRLRQVEIFKIYGTRPELEFIKLLLAKSPMLEKMLIGPSLNKKAEGQFGMLKEVTRFPRASPKAELIYEDLR